jgi:magnesium transporter
MCWHEKIKYKKGKNATLLEYTGVHKSKESELQLFVYDDLNLIRI